MNGLGTFDAVIRNAGVGYRERQRIETAYGLPHVFAINTLAAYILTALINKPKRLVYLSSGMHRGGDWSLRDLLWKERPWNGSSDYADTKLHDVILAFARWHESGKVCSPARWSRAACHQSWRSGSCDYSRHNPLSVLCRLTSNSNSWTITDASQSKLKV